MPLTVHQGEDYIVVMHDHETTDGAHARFSDLKAAKLYAAAPGLARLIAKALAYQAAQFDGDSSQDLDVSGADLVDWFTGWREKARAVLQGAPYQDVSQPALEALEEIAGLWPETEPAPEAESYDDTESAYSNGVDVANYEASQIARRGLLGTPASSEAPTPADDSSSGALDDEDVATILAALRFYQEKGMGEPFNRSDDIHEIATDGGRLTSLDESAIDDLCERINCGAEPAAAAPTDPVKVDMLAALKAARPALVDAGALIALAAVDHAIARAERKA